MKYFTILVLTLVVTVISIGQNEIPKDFLNKDKRDIDWKSIDDVIWVRDSIYYFQYDEMDSLKKKYIVLSRDEKGRMLSAITTVLDSNANWVNLFLTNVEYYNNDLLNDSLVLSWDNNLNEWQDTFFYLKRDIKGNTLDLINSSWARYAFSDKLFLYSRHSTYEYDINSQEVFYSSKRKIGERDWEKLIEVKKRYNSSKKIIEEIVHRFGYWDYDSPLSENFKRYLYTYDDGKNLIEEIFQEKKSEEDTWNNRRKYKYENVNSGQKIVEYWLIWDN